MAIHYWSLKLGAGVAQEGVHLLASAEGFGLGDDGHAVDDTVPLD